MGVLAISMVLVGAAGCSSSDADNAGETVEDYAEAIGHSDYREACGLLTSSMKSQLGGNCESALSSRYGTLSLSNLSEVEVQKVSVSGSRATVRDADVKHEKKTTSRKNGKKKTRTSLSSTPDLTSGGGFTLTKSGDNWQISSGI